MRWVVLLFGLGLISLFLPSCEVSKAREAKFRQDSMMYVLQQRYMHRAIESHNNHLRLASFESHGRGELFLKSVLHDSLIILTKALMNRPFPRQPDKFLDSVITRLKSLMVGRLSLIDSFTWNEAAKIFVINYTDKMTADILPIQYDVMDEFQKLTLAFTITQRIFQLFAEIINSSCGFAPSDVKTTIIGKDLQSDSILVLVSAQYGENLSPRHYYEHICLSFKNEFPEIPEWQPIAIKKIGVRDSSRHLILSSVLHDISYTKLELIPGTRRKSYNKEPGDD